MTFDDNVLIKHNDDEIVNFMDDEQFEKDFNTIYNGLVSSNTSIDSQILQQSKEALSYKLI